MQARSGDTAGCAVEFYPYARIYNTIRQRKQRTILRISDVLKDAPEEILKALITVLVCKLLNQKAPRECRKLYRSYILSPEIQSRAIQVRRLRGRKKLTGAIGKVHNLQQLFQKLNREYFDEKLAIEGLSWSRRKARKTLGHYDSAHDVIIINRRLDNPLVPETIVEFILYHEMLHAFMGNRYTNGKRFVHHREFKEREKQFKDYRRAKSFIKKHFG
jgi:hypothetical protein